MTAGLGFRGILYVGAMVAAIISPTVATGAGSRLIISPQTAFAIRAVAAHNELRAAVPLQPATWDAHLAASADAYAAELARTGRFEHAPAGMRVGQGENLWMGTRGVFPIERMVADWGSERRMFRPGHFPNVSITGRWEDVAHYTQIIWPSSVRVGCSLRSSAQNDYLVCRYAQIGNVLGERVGMPAYPSR